MGECFFGTLMSAYHVLNSFCGTVHSCSFWDLHVSTDIFEYVHNIYTCVYTMHQIYQEITHNWTAISMYILMFLSMNAYVIWYINISQEIKYIYTLQKPVNIVDRLMVSDVGKNNTFWKCKQMYTYNNCQLFSCLRLNKSLYVPA